jgi:hypothetical protein
MIFIAKNYKKLPSSFIIGLSLKNLEEFFRRVGALS